MTCNLCTEEDEVRNRSKIEELSVLPVEYGSFTCSVSESWVKVSFRETFSHPPFVIAVALKPVSVRIDVSQVLKHVDLGKFLPRFSLKKFLLKLPPLPKLEVPTVELPLHIESERELITRLKAILFAGVSCSECREACQEYTNLEELFTAALRCRAWLGCRSWPSPFRGLCMNLYKVIHEPVTRGIVSMFTIVYKEFIRKTIVEFQEKLKKKVEEVWSTIFGHSEAHKYLDYCYDIASSGSPSLDEFKLRFTECLRRLSGYAQVGIVPTYYYVVKYMVEKAVADYVETQANVINDFTRRCLQSVSEYVVKFVNDVLLMLPRGYTFTLASVRNISTSGFEVYCKDVGTEVKYLAVGVRPGVPHVVVVQGGGILEEVRKFFEWILNELMRPTTFF